MSTVTKRLVGAAASVFLVCGIAACTGGGTVEGDPTTGNPSAGLHTARLSVAEGADAGKAAGRSLRVPTGWRAESGPMLPAHAWRPGCPTAACS
ncbi:hypothetical protein [Curtobacterium sp. B8]|uniref:hypothetical protein n=1 Tax=Curtobacterium sp. B8 TaxID=95611 RepID=UPI0011D18698|nr:hypothetical protein [Curtobacterium sp. B8]